MMAHLCPFFFFFFKYTHMATLPGGPYVILTAYQKQLKGGARVEP